ncbi:MAG: dihydropteroate synthase, partial [Bacteroidia bacterium]
MTAAPQPPAQILSCAGRAIDLSQPHVMGILNVTPDSFSDGGRFVSRDTSLRHAAAMVAQGASFVDVGGESTRPGAAAVSVAEELDRVISVVEAISRELDVVVSVDSSKAEVIHAAAGVGAGLINDVRALQEPGALLAAAES